MTLTYEAEINLKTVGIEEGEAENRGESKIFK